MKGISDGGKVRSIESRSNGWTCDKHPHLKKPTAENRATRSLGRRANSQRMQKDQIKEREDRGGAIATTVDFQVKKTFHITMWS